MNIGTPTEPTISGLRTYLKEFLSDPDVIDVHPILRWLIVNLLVVPFRPHRILHQYQSVWMKEGSPLMVNSKNFVEKISSKNPEFKFEIGMRYGKPSIKDALINLQNSKVEKVVLIPMFPQFAQATSGSCVKKAIELMHELKINTPYEIKKPFYNEEWFTECIANSIEESEAYRDSDLLLFSFHGLPERQIKKMDPSNQYCLNNIDCCESNSPFNEMCYKFHCHTTVKKVVNKLKTKKPYQIGFQSRFGLDAWIKPNTTDVIESLPKEGIKKISVVCPAFVFDCLETLEEIAIRNNEYFVEAGGQSLKMIPALNDNDTWVNEFYGSIKNKFN